MTSRGLAFRGANQIIGSPSNGNYLGCLKLISQFDLFIAEYEEIWKSRKRSHITYLSANICNYFINVMGRKVRNPIIDEVKESKYYSISVDSTPDLTYVDQMTFIIRYVREAKVVKRFLGFIPIEKHK